MAPRLGRRVAVFNRSVTNRLTRPIARRLPGFGVVVHTGRKSGREYQTPVNVFRGEDGYLVALTYGREAEWVRNVLAAGACELIVRGRRGRMESPEILHDESCRLVRRWVRPMLRLLRVGEFMRLAPRDERASTSEQSRVVPRS